MKESLQKVDLMIGYVNSNDGKKIGRKESHSGEGMFGRKNSVKVYNPFNHLIQKYHEKMIDDRLKIKSREMGQQSHRVAYSHRNSLKKLH